MIFRTELFKNTTFKIQSPQIEKKKPPKNNKNPKNISLVFHSKLGTAWKEEFLLTDMP